MSDVKLIVGVEESLSFDALNKGIKSIVDQINKTPPKIAVDIDEASIGRIRKTLSTLGKDIGVDLKFLNTISQQVGNTGKNAGSAFAKNFNGALSTLDTKVNITADNIRNMELMLASNRIDTSSIKKVTKDLESMDIEIRRIHTDMNDNRMRLNISGVDELGRTVTVIKEFNYAADEISTIATHIDHAFDTSADAAKLFQKEVNSAFKSIKKVQEEINAYEFELVKLDPKADAKQISEIESKLKSKYKQFDDIYSVFGNSFSKEQTDQLAVSIANLGDKTDIWLSKLADNSKIKKTTEDIKEFLRLSKEVDKLEESSHKASLSGDKNLADSYNLDRSGKLARMDELLGSLYQDLPSDQFDKLIEDAFSASAALEHLDAKYQDTQDKLSKNIEAKVSNASFDLDIAKIDSGFKKLGDASHEKMPELASDIEQLKELRELMSSQSGNELISTYEKFNSLLEKIQNNIKIVSIENDSTNMGESEKADALNKLSKLLAICKSRQEEWSAAAKGGTKEAFDVYADSANVIEDLIQKVINGKISVEKFGEEFKDLKRNIENSDAAIKGAGKNTKSLGDRFKDIINVFAKWKSANEIFQAMKRVAKELAEEVRAIDTAMTELKKVTDATDSQYEKFLTNATNRAKELGATLVDTISASADMARLGYDLDEASALADSALVYKNVGDGISSIDEASSSIISTMQAFNVEAKNSMQIVDKFNIAGNRFAISSGGVGDALLNSASALAAAGNNIDESIGLITAANEVVQDPQKVGTTLKTVSMFLRAAKTDAEAAGESTEGMAESVSKLRSEILQLTGGKVDIQLDANTFKNTTQVIRDLSQVWDSLSDITQANILERVGGKRNANVVAALINNFETVDEVIAATSNSAGSALAENEKYLDSINGKIAQFKTTFQDLSQSILSSELVKLIIDLGTSGLTFIDSIVDGLRSASGFVDKLIPGLKVLIPMFVAKKIGGGIIELFTSSKLGQFLEGIDAFEKLNGVMSSIKSIKDIGLTEFLKDFSNKGFARVADFFSGLIKMSGDTSHTISGIFKGLTKNVRSFFATGFGKASVAIVAISALARCYDYLSKATERSRKKLQDISSEYNENKEQLNSLNSELETTRLRMYELINADTLTYVEREELEKLKETNKELEREIGLLSEREKILKADKESSFAETAKNTLHNKLTAFNGLNIEEFLEFLSSEILNAGEGLGEGDFGNLLNLKDPVYVVSSRLDEYKKKLLEFEEFKEKYYKSSDASDRSRFKRKMDETEEDYREISSYLTSYISNLQSDLDNIMSSHEYGTDSYIDGMIDEYNYWIDRIQIGLGSDTAKDNAFNRLINQEFDAATDLLEEQGKLGKVTAKSVQEAFDKSDYASDSFKNFIYHLKAIGYISDTTPESLAKVARAFNKLGNEAQESSDSIDDAFKRWEDAQNEVQSGIKFDTLLDVMNHAYDTVADKASDIYAKIGNSDYKAAIDLLIPINADIDDTSISEVKTQLAKYKKFFTFDDDGNYNGFNLKEFVKASETVKMLIHDTENGMYRVSEEASMEKWADSLGITIPMLEAFIGELNEYGADIHILSLDEDFETLAKNANVAAKSLEDTFDDLDIDLDLSTKTGEEKIEHLDGLIEELVKKKRDPNIDGTSIKNYTKVLEYCIRQKQMLEQPAIMYVDTTQLEEDAAVQVQKMQNFVNANYELELLTTLGYDTKEAQEDLNKAINEILGDEGILAKINIDPKSATSIKEQLLSQLDIFTSSFGFSPDVFQPALDAVETLANRINQIFNGERELKFTLVQNDDGSFSISVNSAELDDAKATQDELKEPFDINILLSKATEKTNKIISNLLSTLEGISNRKFQTMLDIHTVLTGDAQADGTDKDKKIPTVNTTTNKGGVTVNNDTGAPTISFGGSYLDKYFNPFALADGTKGFKGGRALVGELGEELIVDRDTGVWYTVGSHGAEFVDIPKDAIVFNHNQTKTLLKNGKISSRGKALASGTAFGIDDAVGGISENVLDNASGKKTGTQKTSSDDSSQIIDYIEILLSRLSRSLENFAKVTDDTSKSFKERNKALEKQIDKTDSLITANQNAADAYLKKANSISLSSGIKEKVRNGSYDITKYDSDTAEKINQYKEYYEKYLEAKDEVNNQKSNKAALTMEQFDLIQSKYDSKYGYQDSRLDYQEALNEKYELLGQGGSLAAQDNSIEIYQNRVKLLKEEQDEYNKLLNSGAIKKNTEDWYKLKEAIASNKAEILETENTIEELNKKKIEIKFDRFEKTREDYENKLSVEDNKVDYWEAVNNKAVAEGHGGSLTAQKEILAIHENRLSVLKEEKSELEAQLKKIPKETDEWYKAKNSVQELNQEIVNTNTELVETKKNIDSINFERFQNVSVDYANKNLKTEGALKKWEDINTTDELLGKHGSIKAQDKLLEWNGVYIESLKNELADMEEKWAKIDKDSQEYADAEKAVREKRDQIRDAENQQLQYANNKRDILFSQYQDLQAEYDNKLGDIDHALSKVNHDIAMAEAKGYKVSKSFYEEQKSLEEERLSTIKQQYAEMKEKFEEAVAVGEIEEGSLEWYEYQKSLDAVEQSANDAELAIENLNQSIKDVDWENFKYLRDTIDELNDEADFYLELMSDEDMFDDKGNITEYGMASIGLRGQKYNTYMEEAAANSKKLKEIEEELAKDPANQKLIDQKKELTDAIYDNILAAKDQKQAMIDLVEDGINYELDALRDLIDEYKDALDKAKDLHDYEKKVNESTSEISSIKKQLSAYSGDDSQEAKLRIQKLQEDLKKAEEGLEETEYDRYISDQKELLDDFYDEYETNLNSRLDDMDVVINDLVGSVNQNAGTINDTLKGLANEFGIELSDDMKAIWGDSKFTDVIQSYVGENSVINKGQTAIISALNNIANNVSKILESSGESSGSNNSSFGSTVDEATSSSVGVNSPGIVNTLLDRFKPYQNADTSSLEYSPGDVVRLSRTTPIYTDTDGNRSFDYYGNIYGGEDNDPKKYYVVDTYGDWVGISVRDDAKTPSYWVNSKDGKISKYKNGGLVDYTGLAWVDGSKSNPEYVLNANDTENLMKLTDDLRKIYSSRLSKSGLTQEASDAIRLDSISSSIISDINKASSLLGNTIGDINITIPIERVQDYNDFVTQLKDDPKFDKLVKSLSLDLLDGKSRLAKNRINWNK